MLLDINLLEQARQRNSLPILSNGAFDSCKVPFVELCDPEKNICTVANDASDETTAIVMDKIKKNILIHGEVN